MKHALLTLICLLALNAAPAAAADRYIFDKTHTNIMWFASHFGFSNSMGQFMDYDGEIILDKDDPEKSSVTISIKTSSIMTGLKKFDEHLKGSDFFNSEKFPEATFVSTKIEQTSEDKAQVIGDLTLLGITKPVMLDVKINKIGVNPYNQKHLAGFTVKTAVKRSEFGIDYALPGIHDEVNILIEAEGILTPPHNTPAGT